MAGLAPEQNELIANHGRDLIVVLDEHHRVLFSSPALEEMLGFESESIAGNSIVIPRIHIIILILLFIYVLHLVYGYVIYTFIIISVYLYMVI